MARRIEHALVMDTDHLPGGGGYAVAGFSEDVRDEERLFAAQNFGISDYLHDPQNARVYFSVFRVPGGTRTAFVRRFAHGRRRSGVQNRLFVHTLFLDDETLEEVHYLPWLLADATFRIGRGDPMPLTLDVAPLLADPAFPPLELEKKISASDAHEQLRPRIEPVERKAGDGAIAAVLDALSRRGPVVLPQGAPFEQLSLVAWSMLPPRDRAALPWTQHDAGNLAGVTFVVSNAPAATELPAARRNDFRRVVAVNARSAGDWAEYQARAREYEFHIESGDLLRWLEYHDANAELIADPRASADVIVTRLQKLAEAVRGDKRDPWVNEHEILRFLWSLMRQREKPVDEWVTLFNRSRINAVVFREPPPRQWLIESEAQVGAEMVTRFFLGGTDRIAIAAKTREAIAAWLIERGVKDVTTASLAGLTAMLAADGSPSVKPLLKLILAREDGVSTLTSTWTATSPQLGDAIHDAVALALQAKHPERTSLVLSLLLPQLDVNRALGARLEPIAHDIGELLRDTPDQFALFASRLPSNAVRTLNEAVATWLQLDHKKTLPLARVILQKINERVYPQVRIMPVVFMVAGLGEPATLWMPSLLGTADKLDQDGDAENLRYFRTWTDDLASKASAMDRDATRQFLLAFQKRVDSGLRVGPAHRALIEVAKPGWAAAGDALHRVLEKHLASSMVRAAEWESIVLGMSRPAVHDMTAAQAAMLATFWRRIDSKDIPSLQPATVRTLGELPPSERPAVITRWMGIARRLPEGERCEDFLRQLLSIAPAEQLAALQVDKEWRELLLGRGTVETLTRLDYALHRARQDDRSEQMLGAIPRIVKGAGAPERAAELLRIAAAKRAVPSIRGLIESTLLRQELKQIRGDEEWLRFLTAAESSLFVYRNLLGTVAASLGSAKKINTAAATFSRMCNNRGRFADGVRVMEARRR